MKSIKQRLRERMSANTDCVMASDWCGCSVMTFSAIECAAIPEVEVKECEKVVEKSNR